MTIIPKIAFIGAGNMAGALIEAIVNSGKVSGKNIIISDIDKQKLKRLSQKYKTITAKSNTEAVSNAQVIFLAVKPQQLDDVLKELKQEISPEKLVVSICAGITTRHIETILSIKVPVIRLMPNTPSLVGQGATAITRGRFASEKQRRFIKGLLSDSGIVVELDEKKFDAVTALSGSGPAYVFYLCEAMQNAGIDMGLGKDIAAKLSRQTIYGAGLMLAKSEKQAKELRSNVTSPGGTTESAIKCLESGDFMKIFIQAVKKAKHRSEELKK